MTGAAYATSAEMAGELGPFPGYDANREHMLRVIRNHRRAAYSEAAGYEELTITPVRSTRAQLPDRRCSRRRARPGTTRWRSARSTASATPRSR